MKIEKIPDTTKVYLCNHVFRHEKVPMLFAREDDGDLVCTCGCEVTEAHVVGFGHLRDKLENLLSEPLLPPSSHYMRTRENMSWCFGTLLDDADS